MAATAATPSVVISTAAKIEATQPLLSRTPIRPTPMGIPGARGRRLYFDKALAMEDELRSGGVATVIIAPDGKAALLSVEATAPTQ